MAIDFQLRRYEASKFNHRCLGQPEVEPELTTANGLEQVAMLKTEQVGKDGRND